MLERPSSRAVVHGKVVRQDYTVERVYLESYPGLFVTEVSIGQQERWDPIGTSLTESIAKKHAYNVAMKCYNGIISRV